MAPRSSTSREGSERQRRLVSFEVAISEGRVLTSRLERRVEHLEHFSPKELRGRLQVLRFVTSTLDIGMPL